MTIDATTAGGDDKIRCDACPVMCYIKPGAASTSQDLPLTVRRIVLCVMLPKVPVAMQNFAWPPGEDTVRIQTCKRRVPRRGALPAL